MPNLSKVLLTVQIESLGVTDKQKTGYKEITYSDVSLLRFFNQILLIQLL